MQDIRSTSQDGEEEVKRKPLRKNHTLEPYQEKSIASLLSAADVSMLEGQKFNEKLALKTYVEGGERGGSAKLSCVFPYMCRAEHELSCR